MNNLTQPPNSVQILENRISQQQQQQVQQFNQDCNICLDSIQQSQKFQLETCKHTFHLECVVNYGKNANLLPIKCPQHDCNILISEYDLFEIIDEDTLEKLERNSLNKFLQTIFQCPTAGCLGYYEIEGPKVICWLCQLAFCAKCRKIDHDEECLDQDFIQLVKQENFRQCQKCFFWVEKTYGCNHITCRCGHEFCYNCGKVWVRNQECRCLTQEEMLRHPNIFRNIERRKNIGRKIEAEVNKGLKKVEQEINRAAKNVERETKKVFKKLFR